jgi:mitogen-activated protein kinase organizer 1
MLPDRLIRQMSAHTGPIHAVKFTSDGNYCMSCSDDRTVILCNPHRDGHESNEALHIKTYSGVHGYQILDIAISKVLP